MEKPRVDVSVAVQLLLFPFFFLLGCAGLCCSAFQRLLQQQYEGYSVCCVQAQMPQGMWDLVPWLGIQPALSALEARTSREFLSLISRLPFQVCIPDFVRALVFTQSQAQHSATGELSCPLQVCAKSA